MNNCKYFRNEGDCFEFGTSHGPSTPACDKHFDQKCRTFNQLYHGDRKRASCFNKNVGQEYICPSVSEQMKINSKTSCHHLNPNIGVHELCPYKIRQSGGGIPESRFSTVNPGGSIERNEVDVTCLGPGDPTNYNLASYGYKVVKPDYPLDTSYVGYGRSGCPWNPACPCGENCPCGPSCTCGQENQETKANLGDTAVDLDDSLAAEEMIVKPRKGLRGVHKITGRQCGDKPVENYSCSYVCTKDANGCSVSKRVCQGGDQVNFNTLCKDSIRCGNGNLAKSPNECCFNCNLSTRRILSNPYNKNRQYGLFTQPEEVPNYYFDLTQPSIGNRQVWVRSHREKIPEILLCDTVQNLDKCFDCRQPCWNNPRCM